MSHISNTDADSPPIVNRVSSSSLISLDLEKYYHRGTCQVWDIKDQLYQGLILKEKDFRSFVKEHDWSQYQDQNIAIICSADAIVPTWAYMLVASALQPYAHHFVFGGLEVLERSLIQKALAEIPWDEYKEAKVVIKGCGDLPMAEFAYVEVTRILRGIAKSIMYGEPCSTVPIFKASTSNK